MIWHCSHCATWNANVNDVCILCNNKGNTVVETDVEILDIQLKTVYWYMKAEVENRLHNTQVMSLNGYTIK